MTFNAFLCRDGDDLAVLVHGTFTPGRRNGWTPRGDRQLTPHDPAEFELGEVVDERGILVVLTDDECEKLIYLGLEEGLGL